MSGTIQIAEGVEFSSGWVALHFSFGDSRDGSICIYRDLGDVYLIHVRNSDVRIEWLDSKL